MLPPQLAASIDTSAWRIPPLFEVLRRIGNIPEDDYRRTFNLGVGMVLAVPGRRATRAQEVLSRAGETPFRIGEDYRPQARAAESGISMKRLGILISGRGSNSERCGQDVQGSLDAEMQISFVERPERRDSKGTPARVERRSRFLQGPGSRSLRPMVVAELRSHAVDLVCLAGFMRLLSASFIREFPNRILNIHPSLLPAFPGLDAQHQALEHGVKISGCTVHFVDEDLDAGPIVIQAAVPILDDDTAETLSSRILRQEHRIYSEAISIVLAGNYRIAGRRVILS